MTVPGTFERVYGVLRERLCEGVYKPGDRLEPAALSYELNASVTPVRDALHRLTGERLVAAPRQEGFRVPMMTETSLRHLYGWHLDLLLCALMRRTAMPSPEMAETVPGSGRVAEPARRDGLFRALAASTGNPEYVAALDSLVDRLGPIQRIETQFLDGTEAETAAILQAFRAQDRKALRSSLVRYHRRRQKVVPAILAALLNSPV